MIYLASPYTHIHKVVRLQRYEAVCKHAAHLMMHGSIVFSPIAHSHSIGEFGKLPQDLEFWIKQDRAFLDVCTQLRVLMLKGWQASKGVKEEIAIMKSMGKPVFYEEPYGEKTE